MFNSVLKYRDKAMKNGRRTGYLLAGIYLSLVTQGTCIPASSRPSSFLKFLPSPELPDLHPSSMISHPPTAYKSSFKSLPPSSLPFPSLPFLFSPSSKHQEGPMVHQLPSENHNDAVQNNQGLRYIPVYMINSKPQRYREDRSVFRTLGFKRSIWASFSSYNLSFSVLLFKS